MRKARVLSLLLALVFILALLPATAAAATEYTVTFHHKVKTGDDFAVFAVQTVPRKGHPTPPANDPPSYTDGAYRYDFKEWYWYYTANSIATFSFTSDNCKIWSDTDLYASYTQYLAEGWRMVITKGGSTYFVTDTSTPVQQILKQYAGYDKLSVEQYGSGSGGGHSHSYDYANPSWEWGTVGGKLIAEVSYPCECGESEKVTLTPSYTEDRAERTYLATDSHGNSDTKTVTLSYSVTLNGETQGEQYQWGDICVLSESGRKAWYLNSAAEANKVADGVNSYSFAVIGDTAVATGKTSATAPAAAVSAWMRSTQSGTAVFDAMWTVPAGARVKSVAIYSGTTNQNKTVSVDTLTNHGAKFEVPLLVRNGSYQLCINNLNAQKFLHSVIVIEYIQGGEAQTLVSAVQKILPNGNG